MLFRSEESGAVSIARKGEIRLRLDSGQLRSELAAIFTPDGKLPSTVDNGNAGAP